MQPSRATKGTLFPGTIKNQYMYYYFLIYRQKGNTAIQNGEHIRSCTTTLSASELQWPVIGAQATGTHGWPQIWDISIYIYAQNWRWTILFYSFDKKVICGTIATFWQDTILISVVRSKMEFREDPPKVPGLIRRSILFFHLISFCFCTEWD